MKQGSMKLKSDLRGIETRLNPHTGKKYRSLKSDLRGIETRWTRRHSKLFKFVKIRP